MIDRSAIRAVGLALVAVSCCLALPLLVAAGVTVAVGAVAAVVLLAAAVATRVVIAKRNAKETLVREDDSASMTADRAHRAATAPASPLVEILYFDGCPNHEGARAIVERVSRELGLEPELRLVEVPDEEAARRLRFLGSPTIRVAGEDVDPTAGERADYVLSCRVYRTEDGYAGQPDERWVRDALERQATKQARAARVA